MKHAIFTYVLIGLVSLSLPSVALSKPKVVPGGANQIAGVQVTYPSTAFNGFVRIKPLYFGPARPQDGVTEQPADPNTKVVVFSGVISDGRTEPYMDNPLIVLSDPDGVAITARTVQPNGIILQQATGAKLSVVFWVPKDFVADHLTYTCQSARCKAIRFKFKH